MSTSTLTPARMLSIILAKLREPIANPKDPWALFPIEYTDTLAQLIGDTPETIAMAREILEQAAAAGIVYKFDSGDPSVYDRWRAAQWTCAGMDWRVGMFGATVDTMTEEGSWRITFERGHGWHLEHCPIGSETWANARSGEVMGAFDLTASRWTAPGFDCIEDAAHWYWCWNGHTPNVLRDLLPSLWRARWRPVPAHPPSATIRETLGSLIVLQRPALSGSAGTEVLFVDASDAHGVHIERDTPLAVVSCENPNGSFTSWDPNNDPHQREYLGAYLGTAPEHLIEWITRRTQTIQTALADAGYEAQFDSSRTDGVQLFKNGTDRGHWEPENLRDAAVVLARKNFPLASSAMDALADLIDNTGAERAIELIASTPIATSL